MTYEELAEEIRQAGDRLFELGKMAGRFENCRIMHIAEETLKGMSYSLEAIVESLVEE